MKKLVAVVLLTLLTAFVCYARMGAKDFEDFDKVFADAQPDEGKLQNEILPRLDKAIAVYPDDSRLVMDRLSIFIRLGLLENAQKDADRMIALTNDTSYRYLACTIAESIGGKKREEYLQCYRDVYALHNSRVKTIDYLHVLASSMGEMPDAEKSQAYRIKTCEAGLKWAFSLLSGRLFYTASEIREIDNRGDQRRSTRSSAAAAMATPRIRWAAANTLARSL